MNSDALRDVAARLESTCTQVAHSGTTGQTRVQLQVVQDVESALHQADQSVELKDASHGIMASLLRLLEQSVAGPVRSPGCRDAHEQHGLECSTSNMQQCKLSTL